MVQHAQLHPHKCEGQYIQRNTSLHFPQAAAVRCVVEQMMIRPLHHLSHTWQRNAMQNKDITKVGPVSSIAPEG